MRTVRPLVIKLVSHLVALTLSGCVMGDSINILEIKIAVPQTDEREAIDQFVSSVRGLGYKKGGQWIAEDKSYYEYNKPCNWAPECIENFMKIAKWVESPERKTNKGISFLLDKVNLYGVNTSEPHIDVTSLSNKTYIELYFKALGSLQKWEKDDYREMKRVLTSDYGQERVFATDDP